MDKLNPKQYFLCKSGKVLTSLQDLIKEFEDYAKGESLSDFEFHVINGNNDYANWLSDILHEKELAEAIRYLKNPSEVLKILNEKLNSGTDNEKSEDESKSFDKTSAQEVDDESRTAIKGVIPEKTEEFEEEKPVLKKSEKVTTVSKEMKSADISTSKYFICKNGVTLTSLKDLLHEFKWYSKGISLETFKYHISNNNNDYANWIFDVLGNKSLAERVRHHKDPEKILKLLEEEVKNQKEEPECKVKPLETEYIKKAQDLIDNTKKIKQNINEHEIFDGAPLTKLKEDYFSLMEKISKARKDGKDVFIASLKMKLVSSKFKYYEASGEQSTLDEVKKLLEDVKAEYEEAMNRKEVDVKKEIIEQATEMLGKEV